MKDSKTALHSFGRAIAILLASTAAYAQDEAPAESAPESPAPESPAPEDAAPQVEVAATAEVPTDEPDLEPAFVERPYMRRYIPEANSWELGLFGGMMFPSSEHQLFDPSLPATSAQPFKTAGVLGVRVAYFPLAFLGVEVEGAAMPSQLEDGSAAGLWRAGGHLIGQLPGYSLTPFVVFGAGVLGASSTAMGSDDDDEIHFGLGAKLALDDHVSVRLDLRDVVSRRRGGSQGDGAHSPELTIGITFTPTRRKPDFDGDTVLDGYDECPTVTGDVAFRGCPAPDADGDGVADAADNCPDVPGDQEDGCPTQVCPVDGDGDGVLDRIDECPTEAGVAASNGCPADGAEPALEGGRELPVMEEGEEGTEAPEGEVPPSNTDTPQEGSEPGPPPSEAAEPVTEE